ncbi:MAG: hypothetical protein AB3X44_06655 [Leptothrix sp. (in: b-proteobacteria)]
MGTAASTVPIINSTFDLWAASSPVTARMAASSLTSPNNITLALAGVIITVIIAALVIHRLPETTDIETKKIRFAAATFTGIMIVFVFAAILYFGDPEAKNAGKEIFEKAITAMTPLVGVIVGYLFGTKQQVTKTSEPSTGIKTPGDPIAPPLKP